MLLDERCFVDHKSIITFYLNQWQWKCESRQRNCLSLFYFHYPQGIECFHSRGQHLCKFIGTKGSVCIRKQLNSHRTGLGHQHGRRFIVLGHQYGRRDVMWKHSIYMFPKFVLEDHPEDSTVELWYNEGPRNWQNMIAITRFHFHKALFHTIILLGWRIITLC